MLTDADVLKINCEFVAQVKKYLASRPYIAEPSIDCLLPYFKYVGLASIKDCLDYDTLCTLLNAANSFNEVVAECPPITTPCPDQIPLSLSYTTNTCTETYSLNGYPNDTAFMECYTTPNSPYVNAKIKVKGTNSCGSTQNQIFYGGCVNNNCNDYDQSSITYMGGGAAWLYGTDSIDGGSYFTDIYLKVGINNGDVWDVDFFVHPYSSPYINYAVNGGVNIPPADLLFGSANFSTAFANLMNNLSIALYGVPGKHRLSAVYTDSNKSITVFCNPFHEPENNEFFGFDFGFFKAFVFNPNTGSLKAFTQTQGFNSSAIRIKHDVTNISACGNNIQYTLGNSSGSSSFIYPSYDQNATKFNKIVLATPASSNSVALTGTTNTSCTSYTLTATYTPNPNIVVAYWTDGNTVISTENTTTVTEPGTYTFIIETFNVCTISDSITIP